MNECDLISMLTSGAHDRIYDALSYVEKNLRSQPSKDLAAKLVELCSHDDPDIREEAVNAAGFYCQIPEVFPVLSKILSSPEEDDLVLNAAVFAASKMARNIPELRDHTLNLLSQVALNELMPFMVRKSAYALALKLSGRISIDTYAQLEASPDIVIDKELLSSLRLTDKNSG